MTTVNDLSGTQPQSKLRLLWIEDVEDDVVFAQRELKKAGIQFVSHRVETEEDFIKGIDEFSPDVILSDHGLPQFNSVEAFRIYKEKKLGIPFILVTGNVSEEFAVNSLKLGIDDYVLKANLVKLPAAILNALHLRRMEAARNEREVSITRQNLALELEVERRTNELKLEKDFTDRIINSVPGILYVAEEKKLVRWNNDLEIISGYSAKELGKMGIVDLIPKAGRTQVGYYLRNTLENGSARFEASIVTKSGELIPFYFTSSATVINDQKLIIGAATDISDLKKTQETLRLHDERMDLAFSNSGNSWWDWDIETGMVESHANRYEGLGYTADEISPTAAWWTSLIHRDDIETVARNIEECLSGNMVLYDAQCRVRARNGEWTWFQLFGKVVTRGLDGRPLRMIGTADNITRNKQIERELIDSRYAAEAANRTKSQFLANMSHEIRTPLNAVIGLTHLLMKTGLTFKQEDYLRKVQSSSESLLGIINDILDFSKIEAGKLTLEEVNFDLEEVLQKLADVITYKAYNKGLEIAFGISSKVVTNLIGDPVRLEQVLTNLCSNAVKFTDVGEVVVSVKMLDESEDDIRLQFEVKDSGIGMDQKQQSKLFEPFTQADDSISRKYGGTGLGLSIIKRLVEMMDGKVWVQSKPGYGSTFFFTCVLRKQKLARKIPTPSIDLRKLPVLLVDDNRSASDILKEALESFSFEVIAVRSGIEAIHYLKNNGHHQPVKLVLMDWKMPEMDGLEAAEIIRRDEEFKDVKIILLCTSYANEDLYKKADELNLSGVLIKPIRYSTLYDTIVAAMENGEGKLSDNKGRAAGQALPSATSLGHILLVEDNEINQQVARELLEGYGYTLEIANNGVEAIYKVRESGSPSRFELILMDLQMPIMGGYKATTEIRKLELYKSIPIVAMTADAMGGIREKCLEAGMVDFVTKPVNPNQLLGVLQKWMKSGVSSSESIIKTQPEGGHSFPYMEGIDADEGLGYVNGNIYLYRDLLFKFATEHSSFLAEVTIEFENHRGEDGLRMMHTLKGMSASLGMPDLCEAVTLAEERLKNWDGQDLQGVLHPVQERLAIVLKAIQGTLSPQKSDQELVPLKLLKPLINELNRLLKDHDLDALNVIEKIGIVEGYADQIKIVKEAVRKYDFEKASEILATILVE